MAIPIRNLYYLLCYAWNKLDEAHKVEVEISDYDDAINLLARVFTSGCQLLFKKGLDRSYLSVTEPYAGIKGKIDFSASLNRNLFSQGRSVCTYDVFEENILLNQILKAVLKRLVMLRSIDKGLKNRAYAYYNRIGHVSDISLSLNHFKQVRLHRNNSFYQFLLNVGRLIIENSTFDEQSGAYQFMDFTRDPKQMAALFEDFVRNFYKREQKIFKVNREDIYWQVKPRNGSNISLLPKMQTDISLVSTSRKIVMDAKFYGNTLVRNYDIEKFHSAHLYQLYSYLKNLESDLSHDCNSTCEGILLYPTVDTHLDEQFLFGRHVIRLVTIDLNAPWEEIHKNLLGILNTNMSDDY